MNTKLTILLIEDEKNITAFIMKILKSHDFKVICASTGTEGISLISSQCPDLVLLDLGLPDIDGMEVISRIRTWYKRPIIVLSARNSEPDKVTALDAGADDYITKPFGTEELMARIRTSLRHSHSRSDAKATLDHPFSAKGLTVDYEKRRIFREGEEIHLTPIEYKIVAHLAQNSGKVLTYSSIMENVWGPYMLEDNKILRVNMANIRRKLEPNPAEPQYIFTEISVGYRMIEDESV